MAASDPIKIRICKSCVKDCDFKPKKFRKKVARELGALLPDQEFDVEITSCLKVCPDSQIAFSVKVDEDKGVRTATRTPSIVGLADEVMSLLKMPKRQARPLKS